MIETEEYAKFAQVAHRVDPQCTLLRAEALKGGVSAQMTALEVAQPDGQTRKLIVRRHGPVDLAHNPRIAADEHRLLRLVRAAGVAAPTPYDLDTSCDIFPTPYIVIEYVEGETAFAPADLGDFIRQFAAQLAQIHAVDCATFDMSFLPSVTDLYAQKLQERPAILDESLDEGRIRDALELVWPLPQHNPSVMLHGDFWPGNTLWRDGRLVGVIDWEDAKIGDPLADLANSRLELLWAFGADAMREFTQHYLSMTALNGANLPYWDLCAALRPAGRIAEWAGDETAEKRMRERHREFVTQAFAQFPIPLQSAGDSPL